MKNILFASRALVALVILPFAPVAWIATTCGGIGLILLLYGLFGSIFNFLTSRNNEEPRDALVLFFQLLAVPYMGLYFFVVSPAKLDDLF